MRHRFQLTGLSVAMAVAWVASAPIGGQTSSPPAQAGQTSGTYRAPRTPDGQPDLQGFWSNQTYTPLERPSGVTKAFYTAEELEDRVKNRAVQEAELTVPGTDPDVHYDFTQFGLDRSQATLAHNLRTSLIVDPANGRLPPLNEEGRRRGAEAAAERQRMGGRWDAAENNELDDRCIIMRGAGPPMLNTGYNSNYQIIQSRDYVMILVEMIHDARIIPLDGRAQPSGRVRQWMGVSNGRWEGETLVVGTTHFNGKNPLNGSSDQLRVTEWFTRVADDRIDYRFSVEDPANWERPWTAEMPMAKTVGPLFEHACHEGNRGLYNTLVGARLEEQRTAEEAAREQPPR